MLSSLDKASCLMSGISHNVIQYVNLLTYSADASVIIVVRLSCSIGDDVGGCFECQLSNFLKRINNSVKGAAGGFHGFC